MHIPDTLIAPLVIVVANNLQALILRTVRVVKEHKAQRLAPVTVAVPVALTAALQPLPLTSAPPLPTADEGELERLALAQLYQKRLQEEFGIDAQGHIRS